MGWSRLASVGPVLLLLQGCGDKHEGFCKENNGVTKVCKYADVAAYSRVGARLKQKGMKPVEASEYADAIRMKTKCLGSHGDLSKAGEDEELMESCITCKPFDIVDADDDKLSKYLPLMTCMVNEWAKDAGKEMKEVKGTGEDLPSDNRDQYQKRAAATERSLGRAIKASDNFATKGWLCDAPEGASQKEEDECRDIQILTFEPKDKDCKKCVKTKWSAKYPGGKEDFIKECVTVGFANNGGLIREFPRVSKSVITDKVATVWKRGDSIEATAEAALDAVRRELKALDRAAEAKAIEDSYKNEKKKASKLELGGSAKSLLDMGTVEVTADGQDHPFGQGEAVPNRVVFQDLLADQTGQQARVESDFWDIGAARLASPEPDAPDAILAF